MKIKKLVSFVVVMTTALLFTSGTGRSQSSSTEASGIVTPLLQYQGRLTDPTTGSIVPDGVYAMNFQMFNVESGGTALWSEGELVTVQKGLFSCLLGDTNPLAASIFNGQALWLDVAVAGEQLGPRQPVIPVAYAISLVPGAVVEANTAPVLEVNNLSGGEALQIGGNLNVNGRLIGGLHYHSGDEITSGTVADARIAASVARDSEIWPTVLANDGSGSTLDADLLDGVQASAFSLSSHLHDDRYYTESESSSLFVNATGDTMSGALTVPKINYSSPRTHYFSVGGEGFLPAGNVDYSNSYGMGGAYVYSGSEAMSAPVHLPQGAVVTSFRVYFYDNSTSNLEVSLAYIPATGAYYTLAEVDSIGLSGYSNRTTTSINYPTIDNVGRTYHIRAWCDTWDGSNLRIMGVLVTYTISEAP